MLKAQLEEAVNFVRGRSRSRPAVGIILGSGLGHFAEGLQKAVAIPTAEVPHYPISTAPGHAGRLVFGWVAETPVLAVQGRVHAYEGYPLARVVFPVHLMAELGVGTLVVTNAAGGLNPNFRPGDLMVIVDHINLMFDNPLLGPNGRGLGPRFPDMCEPYSQPLIELAEATALELGVRLQKGVLAASKGPSYETAAEVRMLRSIGGDAATMSTVPEVIAAVYRGLRVLGISCITNLATGLSPTPLTHEEVTEVAARVRERFTALISAILARMSQRT